MTQRFLTLAAIVAATGLTATATALATEGPPPGGPALPNPLAPVVLPPAGQAPTQSALPRVLAARITPQRVVRGHRSRLRIALAGPGRVGITIERVVRGRRHRVSTRTVAAPLGARILRLPARLRLGRYRVTIVAFDAAGRSSRPVHRALVVVRR